MEVPGLERGERPACPRARIGDEQDRADEGGDGQGTDGPLPTEASP